MANRKISDLTALTATATGDLLPIVDISEAAAADKNKKITIEKLFQGIPGNVGIGTSSPNALLDVRSATAWVGDGTTDAFLQFNQSATAANRWHIGAGSGNAFIFYKGTYGTGVETARIDSSGRLLVGTSSARTTSTVTWLSQIEGTGFVGHGITANNNSTSGAYLSLAKSRGAVVGSNTIVQNNDGLGYILFSGADGTDANTQAAFISCEVDGVPGVDNIPGRLVFSTAADGANSPTERMRIKSTGTINFSSVATYADNTAALAGGLVAGDVYRKSDGTLMITY